MKITTGNFGNVLPAQTQPRDVGRGTGSIIAEGLGQVADSVGRIEERGRRQIEQQEVQQKVAINYEYEQQNRLAKMQAENDYSTAMLDLHNSTAQIKQDVLNGSKNSVDADKEIQALSDDRWSQFERNVPIEHIPEFKARYQGQVNGQRAALVPAQIQANQNNEFVLIDQAMSINSRNPDRMAGAQGFAKVLQNSNISDAKKQELAFAFVGQQDRTELNGRLMGARETKDLTAVDTLLTDLDKPEKWRGLDAQGIDAYKAQAIGLKTQIERSNQVAADTRERSAKQLYGSLLDQVQSGGALDPSVWDDARLQFEGTTFAGKEKTLVTIEKDISEFSRLPFPQQAERIRAMRTTFAEKPTSNPKELQETLQTYERAFEARTKQTKNDPLGIIASLEGKPQPALNFGELLVGDGSGLTNQLNARMTKLAALQQRDGYIVAANPFYPEEISTIKGVLANGDDAIKLQVLASITKSVKLGDKYDNALLNGALNAIAGDNPALRLAGFVQAKNLKSSAGANVASLVLVGDRVRKSKTITLPQDSIIRQEFNTVVGDAIPAGTQQHQDFLQLTQFIYAGLSAREGKTDQSSDSIDNDLLDKAVSLATGGIGEHAGRNLILPYGMDENDFANKLHGALAASADSAGLNVDDINDSPLLPVLNAKQGQYFISDGRGGAVINPKTKRPLLVDINKVAGSPAQAPRNLMLERK